MRSVKSAFAKLMPAVWTYRRVNTALAYMRFVGDFKRFQKLTQKTASRFELKWKGRFPCLEDQTEVTRFDRHYIYHTAWAARMLAQLRPDIHIDISSSLYFCSIVSAFMPVRFYDYRPVALRLNNLSSELADIMALPFSEKSIQSLSCMHVVEHIGLGRYGDPLDPDGDLKAIAELQRVVAVGGNLLFVVPIGRPRVMFNAHRIYAYRQIIELFSEFKMMKFSLIPDDPKDGDLVPSPSEELVAAQNYGCGCFYFKRT
jgi:hypothetical protein